MVLYLPSLIRENTSTNLRQYITGQFIITINVEYFGKAWNPLPTESATLDLSPQTEYHAYKRTDDGLVEDTSVEATSHLQLLSQ